MTRSCMVFARPGPVVTHEGHPWCSLLDQAQMELTARHRERSIRSLHLFQRAAAAYECPTTFSDVGMHDAVFEILDVDHCRLVRFLPTDHEDIWPDWRDRNLHGLRGSLEGTI